jgi:tripartite ATP-independent transporter DctM subunit
VSPETVGVLAIGLLLFLFLLGLPIGFTMAFVGFVGLLYLNGPESALNVLAQDIFDTLSSYPLSVIPTFILMGSFAYASGISQKLYAACYTWFGALRGGLTIATVIACSGFAAVCGSTAATAATMGKIAIPEMQKYKYNDKFATGTVAAAGTLGILIPPSTVFIVYGILTEQSIGKLFVSGIVPGIILTLLFIGVVMITCIRHPDYGPPGPKTSWGQKFISIIGIIPAALLFILSIGGLFLGWFSPTQAGAIGASGALLLGIIQRELTLKAFTEAGRDGLKTACMVLFIITGATIFGHFMAVSNIPFLLADWVGSLPVSPVIIMAVIVFLYFIGGFFMDSMAMIVVTIPIFYPVVAKLGFDPIWFGVMVVIVCEMGVITPPVGVNVFVIKGIAPEIPLYTIFRGIFPYLYALIILAVILFVFPILATWLPALVY